MFDQLFRYPAVLRRHRNGPFAQERATYLTSLAIQGSPTGTVLKCARYCLAIAQVLQTRPADHSFTTSEIDGMAREWAAGRVQHRHAAGPMNSFGRPPRDFSNFWAAGRRPERRHTPTHARWTILSRPNSKTDYGRPVHAPIAGGRSSSFLPFSRRSTANWRL